MKLSVGMAIRITEENRDKLSIVNGTVIPEMSKDHDWYFVFPYDHNEHTVILHSSDFFAVYEFANTQDPNYFVEIDEI